MGLFGTIRNKIEDLVVGIKRSSVAEYVVQNSIAKNKFWKNFKDFDKYDYVKVPCDTRLDAHRFIETPASSKANYLDLVLNPAIKEMTFSMESLYSHIKPLVCFTSTFCRYDVPAGIVSKKAATVFEIGRIFIRLTPFGNDDPYFKKNLGEARYVIVEDDKSVQVLPVLVSFDDGTSKRNAEQTFYMAVRYYMAIQYAIKYKPEVLPETAIIRRHKSNEENDNECKKGKERIVKVRKMKVLKKEEAPIPESPVIEKASGNTIQCPAWGVSGHYRHLRDGRVIWIKPYVKGKERNNPAAYSKKTYQILNN